MTTQFKTAIIATVLSLAASHAMAASISLVTKETGSAGSSKYTYSYTCGNGTKGTISVSAATDNSAQKLAETKARRVCEEP
ncbi:MAG: hypothetical protein AB7T07_04835 [Steroidobacteraceae bacterium]